MKLLAVPFYGDSDAELDVARRELTTLSPRQASPDRPADAVYQTYGTKWIAMAAIRENATLCVVTSGFCCEIPAAPAPDRVRWRRLLVSAELLVADDAGRWWPFRYRPPLLTAPPLKQSTIEEDLSFWLKWRMQGQGLGDWVRDLDWRLNDVTTIAARTDGDW
jgi:hypothetical protein